MTTSSGATRHAGAPLAGGKDGAVPSSGSSGRPARTPAGGPAAAGTAHPFRAVPVPALPALRRGIFDDTLNGGGAEIVHVFARADDPGWVRQAVREIAGTGRTPLVTVEPWDAGRSLALPDAAQARALADALRDPRRVLVRYLHEWNGTWYPWGEGLPAGRWREAWARLADALPENAQSVWCPNVGLSDLGGHWPSRPPDVVGIDGYDWGIERRREFGEVVGPMVRWVRPLAGDRPLMVCETATRRGPGQVRWVREMLACAAAERLAAVCWFSVAKERDWRLSPAARRAFLGREGR